MYHVWLRNHIVLERNGRREVTELYVRGAGGRLIRSHNHLWFVYNNRGDVAQRVDNAGQVLHTYRFSAFGVEINPDPSNSNPWRFNGEYHDMHRGGEVYLRMRNYNPRTGRFSQADPFFHAMHGNLQSCVTQAGNLYMFVMHNPVMWVDPWGLFAWNEDYNHWFNLFSEVSNAGGTSSFSASTRTASINLWGVDVNFNLDDFGVRIRGVTLQVRADTFYSSLLRAAGGEMIFLGSNDVLTASHAAIAMFIGVGHGYWDDVNFAMEGHSLFGGAVRFATIGAGPSGSNPFTNTLSAGFNRAGGPARNDQGDIGIVLGTAAGAHLQHLTNNAGSVSAIFSSAHNFLDNHNNTLTYHGRPRVRSNAFNSNSFAHGLLLSAGIAPPGLSSSVFGHFPGWNSGQNLYNRGVFR